METHWINSRLTNFNLAQFNLAQFNLAQFNLAQFNLAQFTSHTGAFKPQRGARTIGSHTPRVKGPSYKELTGKPSVQTNSQVPPAASIF
jgi:hypothetical protein